MFRLKDKYAYSEPLEDRNKLIEAKIELFHVLISFNPGLLTDLEVDIGYLLVKDPDIQARLEGGLEKKGCFPRPVKGGEDDSKSSSTDLKKAISKILQDARRGSEEYRTSDGYVRWGKVEKIIHKQIDDIIGR